jgi:signal transduction histidine kinase
MRLGQSLLRAIFGGQPSGRLSEFTLRGRIGPLLATAIALVVLYLAFGRDSAGIEVFIKLCAAAFVPYAALAALAAIKGTDAPWIWILPVAVVGVIGGGLVSAAVAIEVDRFNDPGASWDLYTVLPHWSLGAAFSAFFIGLSLATTAVRRQEQIEFETRRRLLEARLQTLTARIEPHFLMNTLANLSALVESDSKAAHEMLEHLADLLQAALEHSRDPASTLGKELELIESYLAIMRMRLGDKLRFKIQSGAGLDNIAFPALLLQTLVENAVVHGIEPGTRGGTVTVEAGQESDHVIVTIADDGVGFDSEQRAEGTGLQNVRDRLDSFFSGKASFRLDSSPGRGTTARVVFPAVRS